jgi:hypothetical protein
LRRTRRGGRKCGGKEEVLAREGGKGMSGNKRGRMEKGERK